MTTWYIIRHAEKVKGDYFNPVLRHQDEPLSPAGQTQSIELYDFLARRQIAAVYISAYLRTRQTIEYSAQQLNLTPILDERLNEIDNGYLDGMSDEEIEKKYPETLRAFHERSADFRFPGGETGEEARQRIASFFDEKLQQHGQQSIAVVSHEGLIRIMACHILGLPVYKRWNFGYDFCGITEITYQPAYQQWQLKRFNYVHTLS